MDVRTVLIVCELDDGIRLRRVKDGEPFLRDEVIPESTVLHNSIAELFIKNGFDDITGAGFDVVLLNKEKGVSLSNTVVLSDDDEYIRRYTFSLVGPDTEFLETVSNELVLHCQAAGYRRKAWLAQSFKMPDMVPRT